MLWNSYRTLIKPLRLVIAGVFRIIVDAVLYLVQAGHVSGEILHVDGAAPARHW